MERFVLVPEACPVVSITSTVARHVAGNKFPAVVLRKYSPWMWLVWALARRVSDWIAAAYPAWFDGRASRDELYSSGRKPRTVDLWRGRQFWRR